MKILGCDLPAKQQTIAMVDRETGEFTEKTLSHEGNEVREFYAALEGPVVVGIEATGAMPWFLELLEELGMVCRVVCGLQPGRRHCKPCLCLATLVKGSPEHIASHSAQLQRRIQELDGQVEKQVLMTVPQQGS